MNLKLISDLGFKSKENQSLILFELSKRLRPGPAKFKNRRLNQEQQFSQIVLPVILYSSDSNLHRGSKRELPFASPLTPLRCAHQPNGIQATLPKRCLGGREGGGGGGSLVEFRPPSCCCCDRWRATECRVWQWSCILELRRPYVCMSLTYSVFYTKLRTLALAS